MIAETARRVFTPSEVGHYVKGLLERDRMVSRLLVRGEISNWRRAASGHLYFTLKDGEGAVQCVMYRREAAALRFRPENGMQIIAEGGLTVFVAAGQYQLRCDRLTPEGAGGLAVAFEQLKLRLQQQGLFDDRHKKPIPAMPGRIALVTSPTGAAVRDMIRILGGRWPMAQVWVVPVLVQGTEAAGQIAQAIRWVNLHQAADLIITGRGGGSMEDLWAFNEEAVARAIYDSVIPVISAVGHEPDVTIADFAADMRASTPSNAAERAVPDQNEVYAALLGLGKRLEQAASHRLQRERQHLKRLADSRVMTRPQAYFQDKRVLLDYQTDRLVHGLERTAALRRQQFGRLAAALDAMSPLKVLGRGYAIARKEDGGVIASVRDAAPGERFALRLSDGALGCRVEQITETGEAPR